MVEQLKIKCNLDNSAGFTLTNDPTGNIGPRAKINEISGVKVGKTSGGVEGRYLERRPFYGEGFYLCVMLGVRLRA